MDLEALERHIDSSPASQAYVARLAGSVERRLQHLERFAGRKPGPVADHVLEHVTDIRRRWADIKQQAGL